MPNVAPLTVRLHTPWFGIAVVAGLMLTASVASAENAKAPEDGIVAVEREAFSIRFKPSSARVGAPASVTVAVKAKGAFHLNQQYPHKLKLEEIPVGIRVEKTDLTKADATLEDRALTFTIPATPEKAGRYAIRATLKTSVCDESQCILKSERITLRVTGK